MKTISRHKVPSTFRYMLFKFLDIKTIVVFIIFAIMLFFFLTLVTISCKKEVAMPLENESSEQSFTQKFMLAKSLVLYFNIESSNNSAINLKEITL